MTNKLSQCLARRRARGSIPIVPLDKAGLRRWRKAASAAAARWTESTGFEAAPGTHCLVADARGTLECVLAGAPKAGEPFGLSGLADRLPMGEYHFAPTDEWDSAQHELAALGWALACYRFARYKQQPDTGRRLGLSASVDYARVAALVESTWLTRDLINTPAEDMNPAALAAAATALARKHGAKVKVTTGASLLKQNYPAIHAVGRAADYAPRLVDLRWGRARAPRVTLVGKGVCFDSGGLDIKPAAGMRMMKKDMGGAAHALGLANAIMATGLDINLRVLVPAVENAIAGNAYRPGDILQTRKGLTVEVDNTDAEGRIILCDALTEACTDKPECLLDFATLTGAARVALGTELPAMFCNDEGLGAGLLDAGTGIDDPLWRLPLHQPYLAMLDSPVADTLNSAASGFGGAITAALFLERFIEPGIAWAHFDLMAYNQRARPGRPVGGEAMSLRACYAYLEGRYGKSAPRRRRNAA